MILCTGRDDKAVSNSEKGGSLKQLRKGDKRVASRKIGSPSHVVTKGLQSYIYSLSLSRLTRIPDLKRSINAHG